MYPGPYEALNLNHAPNPLLRIVNLVSPKPQSPLTRIYPEPYEALNLNPPPAHLYILDLIKPHTSIPPSHLCILDLVKP